MIGRLSTKSNMTITVSLTPPGYREPNVRAELEVDLAVSGTPVMAFYGECMGIAIVKQNPNELKLSFITLYENDGWWYTHKGMSTDSYWMPELIEVLQEAHRWMKANARKSKDGCGWEAKK